MKTFFLSLIQSIREILKPPQAFSWQTLIWLSVFSGLMSNLSTDFVQNLLAFFGWIFLILGISWVTTEELPFIEGIAVGAWITGALLCIFVCSIWTSEIPPIAYILWFPVSACLASLRHLFDENSLTFIQPNKTAKQTIIILLSANILVACWFQLYFTMQTWVKEYPTILTDEFSQSAFVIRLDPPSLGIPRGGLVLNQMEKYLQDELDRQPWLQVEKWLLKDKNQQNNINKLMNEVKKDIVLIDEDMWWKYKYKLQSNVSGYKIQFIAIWQGPRSQSGEYYIDKICQIIEVNPKKPKNNNKKQLSNDNINLNPPPKLISLTEIKCDPLGKLWFQWYKK